MRLDLFLSQKFHLTRNKSQQLIGAGLVSVNGKISTKPSGETTDLDVIEIQPDRRVHWVSRSAEKLAGFLSKPHHHFVIPLPEQPFRPSGTFPQAGRLGGSRSLPVYGGMSEGQGGFIPRINLHGTICLDVGASTGGFTQVLLEYGASHVDAVDVGTNQLHDSIRQNPRVSSYEQTDIRDFATRHSKIETRPVLSNHESGITSYDVIVCDASFISLFEILPSMLELADEHTDIILLYKPQFEVGSNHLRKTGVPKNEKIVLEKMNEFENFLIEKGCYIVRKEKSTLVGEAGNQEWLYWMKKEIG